MKKDFNQTPPNNLSGNGCNKDTKDVPDMQQIEPDFSGLKNPEIIVNHIQEIKDSIPDATPHSEILEKLLEQFDVIDFVALAYPKVVEWREKLKGIDPKSDEAKELQKHIESKKINIKHYLILSVEEAHRKAVENNWNLCKNNDFIYLYNGTFWDEIDKEAFQNFLGEASEKMGVDKFDSRFYEFRDKLFKQFMTIAYLPTPEPDNNEALINLLNGTFEITPEKKGLRPFNPDDFITYQLPFSYNPDARCPIFDKFLDEVLPDVQRQRILAEALSSVFIKHGSNSIKIEKALMLYGTGANGKSVLFEVVNALLGAKNVSNYSLQSLTNDNGYFRALLSNKLVNYASEINGKLESSFFKQLTSGEPVEARLPYGRPFNITDYAKLIFNVNQLPKDVEHTNAFFRRFLIIPFDVTIPEEKQDRTLHLKIIENELAGVFNWVLDGLERLLNQKGFSECEASQSALNQYKLESDSVELFLTDSEYESNPMAYTLIKDIYIQYRTYCNEDGVPPVKKGNFIKRLKDNGYTVDRIAGNQLAVFVSQKSPFD
ncbi:MAG: phage/plasmid primase, P4 family [Dysgonamonadaceae bacterium]